MVYSNLMLQFRITIGYIWFRLAVLEREKYISRVKAAIADAEKDKEFLKTFEQEMEEYDKDLSSTLDVYLEYLTKFVTMIQVIILS